MCETWNMTETHYSGPCKPYVIATNLHTCARCSCGLGKQHLSCQYVGQVLESRTSNSTCRQQHDKCIWL
jgi:hypothetical protein